MDAAPEPGLPFGTQGLGLPPRPPSAAESEGGRSGVGNAGSVAISVDSSGDMGGGDSPGEGSEAAAPPHHHTTQTENGGRQPLPWLQLIEVLLAAVYRQSSGTKITLRQISVWRDYK